MGAIKTNHMFIANAVYPHKGEIDDAGACGSAKWQELGRGSAKWGKLSGGGN